MNDKSGRPYHKLSVRAKMRRVRAANMKKLEMRGSVQESVQVPSMSTMFPRRDATYKRKSDALPEAKASAWLNGGANSQGVCFRIEEINIKPEIEDYEIIPPLNRSHSLEKCMEMPMEIKSTEPTISSDNAAQLVQEPKNNQYSADDKVANANQAFVSSLKRNFYLETSINGFGNYVTSVLKKFPQMEMQKARQEIMAILDKYQQLSDISVTPDRKSDDSTNSGKSVWLDGCVVSQESDPFQDVCFANEELDIKPEIGDYEINPPLMRPHSPVIEKVCEEQILSRIEIKNEVPISQFSNAAQLVYVEPKISQNNRVNVDDTAANAMETFVDSLRNFYPGTSIHAFENYVTSVLKEIPEVERHKARQEIILILTKYQKLFDAQKKTGQST